MATWKSHEDGRLSVDDVKVEVARLSAQLSAGFEHLNRRQDDVVRVLSEVEKQVRITNGRVTDLEQVNKVRSALQAHDDALLAHPDRQVLTMAWVQAFAKFGGWIVAGLLGLASFAGKL